MRVDYDKDQLAYALANALKERDDARNIGEKLSKQGLDMMDENRSLKRERDEAREEAKNLRRMSVVELMGENLNVKHHVTEWENRCLKAEQERDEARKELEEYRSIAENIGAPKAVSEKEKAIQERDEAIKRYEEISRVFEGDNEEEWKPCTTLGETVARILKERDEARQPNKELHSTDPMWQKPLSTNNPIPYTTSP